MDITPIVSAVIGLCVLVATTYLLPWLRQVIGEKKTEEILSWVEIFVRAAEQIFSESGMGERKKNYVLQRLKEKGFTVDLDELDDMIEATVLQINREVE